MFRHALTLCQGHVPMIENELHGWSRHIDDFIRKDATATKDMEGFDAARTRLRTILSLRLLNSRALLHRPILQRLLAACCSPTEHPLAQFLHLLPSAWNCVDSCFASARELIRIIHRHCKRKQSLGAWWYSLYYSKSPFQPPIILPLDSTMESIDTVTEKLHPGQVKC